MNIELDTEPFVMMQRKNVFLLQNGVNGATGRCTLTIGHGNFRSYEQFEDTPLYIAILTYLGYLILIIVGHIRDLLRRWNIEKLPIGSEPVKPVTFLSPAGLLFRPREAAVSFMYVSSLVEIASPHLRPRPTPPLNPQYPPPARTGAHYSTRGLNVESAHTPGRSQLWAQSSLFGLPC